MIMKIRVLLALTIVGMFIMPIMPATKASTNLHRGDIIFGKTWHPIPQIPEWHHACLFRGTLYTKNVVQSDPHFENWTWRERWWWLTGQFDRLQQSLNSRGVGGVEYTTLSKIHEVYKKVAYAYVKPEYASNAQKSFAVKFAENRKGRHFDIVSYWKYKDKQVDGPPNSRSGWYYCAELVWAAYKHAAGINLDSHDTSSDHRVYPKDIYNSPLIHVFYDEGLNW